MADRGRHDGRFGRDFDDELSVSGVVWSGVAILVCCILGIGITLWIWKIDFGAVQPRDVSPIPEAGERQAPPGPLLQAEPEVELAEMRADMEAHLGSFAWVDRNAGVVRIPIELAMEALVENGVETELAGSSAEEGSPGIPEITAAPEEMEADENEDVDVAEAGSAAEDG